MSKEQSTSNFLIPNHRKLAEDEIKQILEKYNLENIHKLPKIKLKDPALDGETISIGDVVEITRSSFAGESKYYRMVIE